MSVGYKIPRDKLRRRWVQRQSWVERHEGNTWLATRFWQICDQLH
jgi:hypothetical protein